MGMVKTSDTILPICTGFVPDTMGRGNTAQPKERFHLVANRRRRRRLQYLQQIVTKELAAPYTVKYLPDSGQIVLTAETRVVRAVQPEPTMEARLIMALWQIRSLHLFSTHAPYLVGTMTYRVVCEQVYGMLWQLALPESERLLPIRETTRPSMVRPATSPTVSATCASADHPHPRTSCSPGTDGCIGCLMRWMVHRGVRLGTSIARFVAPPAPTNYLVGGY